jgi:Caspase domain
MTLIVNRRGELDGPGLHAIVAGVSHYRHLPRGGGREAADPMGMSQLTSCALSAYRIARWLQGRADRLAAPLSTLRLLLSPSEREIEVEPDLVTVAEPCTFEALRREIGYWRHDACQRRDDIALFYFAGHGVQRVRGDAVLLCQDFGDGVGDVLERAISTANLYGGMAPAPGREEVARTQFYFVDSCRIRPDAFARYEALTPGSLWSVELSGRDDRRAPIFYAAVPGSRAYARPAEETLFCTALLAGLNGDAAETEYDDEGEARWFVTSHKLIGTLADRLDEETRGSDVVQEFRADGGGASARIHHLDGPPAVKLLVEIDPLEALGCTRVEICDDDGTPCRTVPAPLRPHPYTCELPAGMYRISARIDPQDPRFRDRAGGSIALLPPSQRWRRKVSA